MSPLKGWWMKLSAIGTKTENTDLSGLPLEELYATGLNFSLFEEHTKAARYYVACIQQNSDRPEFYVQLARTYLALGDQGRAVQILQDLLLRNGLPVDIRISTSKLLLKYTDPQRDPHKILKIFGDLQHYNNPEDHFWMQKLEAEMQIGYWDEALNTVKLMQRKGIKTENFEGKILTLRLQSRYGVSGQALGGVKKILNKAPKCTQAHLYQIEILRSLKQIRDLQAAWTSFLTICPENAAKHLKEFEDDYFEFQLFGQVAKTYSTVVQAIEKPPLEYYSHWIRSLLRTNNQEALEELSLDLLRTDIRGVVWELLLKELIPHLEGGETFALRFFNTVQEVSQRQ